VFGSEHRQLPSIGSLIVANEIRIVIGAPQFEVPEPRVNDFRDGNTTVSKNQRAWRLLAAVAGVALDANTENLFVIHLLRGLSMVDNHTILEKFITTCDQYWSDVARVLRGMRGHEPLRQGDSLRYREAGGLIPITPTTVGFSRSVSVRTSENPARASCAAIVKPLAVAVASVTRAPRG
jgi:hypothetical protein